MTSPKLPPINEWIVELRQFPEELLVVYRALFDLDLLEGRRHTYPVFECT